MNDQTEVPHSIIAEDERKQLTDRIAALTRVIGRIDVQVGAIQHICHDRKEPTRATVGAIDSIAEVIRIYCAGAINA